MNKKARISHAALLIVCAVVFFPACKVRKGKKAPQGAGIKADKDSFMKTMEATTFNWTYFSSKADIDFQAGSNSNSVNANLRMYKDSLIWFSANMFGIEGARGLVTKDSVWIMDKLHNCYYVYGKEYLAKFVGGPVEIGELQNILINNPVFVVSLYQWVSSADKQFTVQAKKNELQAQHTYSTSYSKIEQTLINQVSSSQKVTISYSDFKSVSGISFPYKIVLESADFKEPVKLEIDYHSPDFTTVPSFPFTIPKSYERK